MKKLNVEPVELLTFLATVRPAQGDGYRCSSTFSRAGENQVSHPGSPTRLIEGRCSAPQNRTVGIVKGEKAAGYACVLNARGVAAKSVYRDELHRCPEIDLRRIDVAVSAGLGKHGDLTALGGKRRVSRVDLSANVGTGDATPFTHVHDGIEYASDRIARYLAGYRTEVFGVSVPGGAEES